MSSEAAAGTRPHCSIVVPVYNESENIGPLMRTMRDALPANFEILIVYDFDGDSTLPALARIPENDRPANVRTVRNDLGRGVRFAIEAGMRAARAEVVIVSMADLCDDYSVIGEMVRRSEAGAAVVCPSRYAKGGRQVGGPLLKGLMSRAAGVSLFWLAGIPTHDPTNSFKAYRKDFLDSVTIESRAGFCLGLELTAKAHFSGRRVEEFPVTWTDRVAGESRFRLWAWLPHYLEWYLWALRRRWLGR